MPRCLSRAPSRQHLLSLPAGHLHLSHVRPGATVLVLAGEVQLEAPPLWLADQMVVVRHTLRAGQSYEVDERGWLALGAPADGVAARLVLQRPASLGETCLAGLGLAARWLRSAAPLRSSRRAG